MLTDNLLEEKISQSYLGLRSQGILNVDVLHRFGFIEGYGLGWKEAVKENYSFAFELQRMIDDCDINATALLRARGFGCAEATRIRGKQKGLEEALVLMYPKYKNRRVFLLNEEWHKKAIADLAKELEDADHKRWIEEETN